MDPWIDQRGYPLITLIRTTLGAVNSIQKIVLSSKDQTMLIPSYMCLITHSQTHARTHARTHTHTHTKNKNKNKMKKPKKTKKTHTQKKPQGKKRKIPKSKLPFSEKDSFKWFFHKEKVFLPKK
ncbi:hypothetical protein LSH36_190g03049 [Paralvinella palmiformis]|uniref:Uncharacterized protein n=1 Tax=Paralvinella palmiformis TaxID=53620 RepID=A0AAD9JRB5_9ANNE|nr:hypothetical protein LSH36_190g03049 [Paralvinella palmiformis]